MAQVIIPDGTHDTTPWLATPQIGTWLADRLAGGPAPFVAGLLLASAGGQPWGVAGYMVVLALLTSIAIYFGPETYQSDIQADQAGV